MIAGAPRHLLPAILVTATLAGLSAALDRGAAAGANALEWIGRLYFALLLGAPLIVYPFARRAGLAPPARVALSLLPGFLWWLAEVRFRLRGHPLPEALWLAASPLNLAHLHLSLLMTAMAELACRAVARVRGARSAPFSRRHALAAAIALGLGPGIVLASVPVFLHGHRALFQAGLLPEPVGLPGPLPEGSVAPAARAGRAPNIVFVLSDDHRADFAGHAGHPFAATPSLDRLAAEGVRFERAYVTSSLCSPSRASFLTGTTPQRHGVWNNFTPWSDANRTFFEYLSQAGYATAFIGKWHMPGKLPVLRGVDHFVTFTNLGGQGVYEWCPLVVDGREEPSRTRYIATELTDRALAWMEAQRDRPFALLLSHKNVHADFVADAPERGRLAATPVELPAGAHPWTHLTNAQYTHLGFAPLGDSIRRYAEALTSLDREIGRVLDFLAARGLERDTFVLYASDNGYLWGEHGLADKRWAYEESIRIPLLVRHPASGHAPGARVGRIVANIDVAPTLLALAGIETPDRMQGRSLLPLLADPEAPFRDALLYRYFFEPPYPTPTQRAIVTPRYKYVEYEGRAPELFDLVADPHERTNLAGAAPSIEPALAARLAQLEKAEAAP